MYGIRGVDGGGGGYTGVDVPELLSWSLNASIEVSDEGEDESDCDRERGVDVLEVVEATVMFSRNLPSGPLL